MLRQLVLCSVLVYTTYASSFDAYKNKTTSEFSKEKSQFTNYNISLKKEFQEYKKAQQKIYNAYKKELTRYWEKPILTTKKVLVNYSKDKKSRTIIDFATNKLTIETLAKNEQEAQNTIKTALAKAITTDTKTFYENNELEQRLAGIKLPKDMMRADMDSKPILSTVIFKKQPTKESVRTYVNKNINLQTIKIDATAKSTQDKIYSVNIKLPDDTTIKRSLIYYTDVKKQAIEEEIPIALIFAIIHSESSFNPMAKSYIPAYGLMQIVPHTAGIDSYYYLYKEKKLVNGKYLYNSKNNITLGSAYLHILYYKYLKAVKNPTSRLYCTIAAYNTGAGNVARAFVRTNDTALAAKKINQLTPDEVYNRLLRDLKYDEPKHYLIKVRKRMRMYKNIYKS
jgi:membrane-bound lytic murein transglycosylase C